MNFSTPDVEKGLSINVFDCGRTILVVWKRGSMIVFRYRITPDSAARMAGMWRRFFESRPALAAAFQQYKTVLLTVSAYAGCQGLL